MCQPPLPLKDSYVVKTTLAKPGRYKAAECLDKGIAGRSESWCYAAASDGWMDEQSR